MGTGTGQYRIGTGDAILGIYTGVVVETACGVFRLSCKLFDTMREWVKSHPPDPVRERLVQHYEPSIGVVYDALSAMGCKPGTVRKYAAVAGELMAWSKGHLSGDLTPEDLTAFMDDLVSRGRESAEQHFGEHWDPHGRGIRRLAYYALKKVLDECFDMELMGSLPPPCRPEPIAATSLETTQALSAAVQDDRERLLLLLVNGLNLQPHEAASLYWPVFDSKRGSILISRSRGCKSLPVAGDLRRALCECKARAGGSLYVFPSNRDHGCSPVSVRTLQNVLGRLVERSGVEEYVTLTSLRKGAAFISGGQPADFMAQFLAQRAAEALPLFDWRRVELPAGLLPDEPAVFERLLSPGGQASERFGLETGETTPAQRAGRACPVQIRIGGAASGPKECFQGARRRHRQSDWKGRCSGQPYRRWPGAGRFGPPS